MILLTIVGLWCGGCASAPLPTAVETMTTDVPAQVAAWVCAEVMRAEAPGADPLPWHAGALASAHGDSFAIEQRRDDSGSWRPVADVRLLPFVPTDGGHVVIRMEIIANGHRAAHGNHGERRLVVAPMGPHASRIELHLAAGEHARVRSHLRSLFDTLDALASHRAEPPAMGCCVQHAPWTARAWLVVANRHRQAGEIDAALAATRTAAALAPELPEAQQRLGGLANTVMHDAAATAPSLAAALLAADPVARAGCTRSLAMVAAQCRSSSPADAMREQADALLLHGDAATARVMRANAMALQPDTIADLQLRRADAMQRDDHRRARESLLLLREYAPDTAAATLIVRHPPTDLSQRLEALAAPAR